LASLRKDQDQDIVLILDQLLLKLMKKTKDNQMNVFR